MKGETSIDGTYTFFWEEIARNWRKGRAPVTRVFPRLSRMIFRVLCHGTTRDDCYGGGGRDDPSRPVTF